MKKKILIGSIIAVALLLLMPSIPAIQQKTVEEKAYSDFVERLKDVDLEDIEVLEWIRHPILYIFVIFLLSFRIERALAMAEMSCYFTQGDDWMPYPF